MQNVPTVKEHRHLCVYNKPLYMLLV